MNNKSFKVGDLEFPEATKACTFFTRLKGLMFVKSISEDGGLLLENCNSVHTFFMKFPINVIYLDKDFKVIGKERLNPSKLGIFNLRTKHVFECIKDIRTINIGDIFTDQLV